MSLMMFNQPIKYKGVRREARSEFRVDESDVEQLRKDGGWVLVRGPVATPDSTVDEANSGNENNGLGANTGEGEEPKTAEELGARLEAIDTDLDALNKVKDEYATKQLELTDKSKDLADRASKAVKDDKKVLKAELKKVKKQLEEVEKQLEEADAEIIKLDAEAEQIEKALDSLVQGEE